MNVRLKINKNIKMEDLITYVIRDKKDVCYIDIIEFDMGCKLIFYNTDTRHLNFINNLISEINNMENSYYASSSIYVPFTTIRKVLRKINRTITSWNLCFNTKYKLI